MALLESFQPALQMTKLVLGFLIFFSSFNHRWISTTPFRRPLASRVLVKKSTHLPSRLLLEFFVLTAMPTQPAVRTLSD
jgi:hypothetical protein